MGFILKSRVNVILKPRFSPGAIVVAANPSAPNSARSSMSSTAVDARWALQGRCRFWAHISSPTEATMRLPDHFAARMMHLLPTYMLLITGDGDPGQVKVESIGGSAYMTQGWASFMAETRISYSDIVVFSYRSLTGMNVGIFKVDGSEDNLNQEVDATPMAGHARCIYPDMIPRRALEGRNRFWSYICRPTEARLRLPDVYAKRMMSLLPVTILLVTGDGEVTQVLLEESAGSAYITSGWADFIKQHGLSYFDMVIFSYDITTVIHVGLFNVNGSENPLNQAVSPSDVSDSFDLCQWLSTRRPKRKLGPSYPRKVDLVDDGMDEDPRCYIADADIGSSQTRVLPATISINQMASCKIVLGEEAVSGFFLMDLPPDFALCVMKIGYNELQLEVGRKKYWRMTCKVSPLRCRIKTGWSQFVLDNYLRAGDTVFFRVLPNNSSVCQVAFIGPGVPEEEYLT